MRLFTVSWNKINRSTERSPTIGLTAYIIWLLLSALCPLTKAPGYLQTYAEFIWIACWLNEPHPTPGPLKSLNLWQVGDV